MKPSEILIKMLRDQHGLELLPGSLERTYAGCNMKAIGAWTWRAKLDTHAILWVGSQYPVSYLIRCKVLEIDHDETGETSVDPSLADMRRLSS